MNTGENKHGQPLQSPGDQMFLFRDPTFNRHHLGHYLPLHPTPNSGCYGEVYTEKRILNN